MKQVGRFLFPCLALPALASQSQSAPGLFDAQWYADTTGVPVLVILLLLALATLVSEDLACITAGLLVARETIGFVPAAAACFLGIFVGDLLLYLAGKYVGRPAVQCAPLRWMIREEDLERSAAWFRKRGPVVLLLTRFLPGSRLPTYVAAGVLRVGFWRFAWYLAIAGLAWTPLLVGFSALVGGSAMHWFGLYQQYALPAVAGIVLALWLSWKLVLPMCTWRGRRLLLSRWRRLTRWEFWPLWAFYPPVVLYILWLGLKHRGLTLFTAANPAIPAGGFLGESKAHILRGLAGSSEHVARWALVKTAAEVERFMERERLRFPIVLKPDVGQRGLGVAVIRSKQNLDAYFGKPRGETIAQEYVAGFEFGVFYYRHPNEPSGRIYSVTEKRMVTVTGDGRSTLEELILKDDRAVCMARFFLGKHRDRLDRVPSAGERVELSDLGTHCRGALFLDGASVKTPALEAAMDAISKRFDGFCMGRYDIRTPSVEEFRDGTNFKIVELNGVTSEATHIYEPGHPLLSGYRTLMTQWRVCFEIAAQNRARGANPIGVRELLAMVHSYEPPGEAH